ncbi:MAG: hypothetical protein IPO31_05900 [Candidatus Obscuribacter sp.]|nr:hypothetical protein [Candidatus Obscuribacter sp.]
MTETKTTGSGKVNTAAYQALKQGVALLGQHKGQEAEAKFNESNRIATRPRQSLRQPRQYPYDAQTLQSSAIARLRQSNQSRP